MVSEAEDGNRKDAGVSVTCIDGVAGRISGLWTGSGQLQAAIAAGAQMLAPALPLAVAAAIANQPGPWLGLALICLLPKLAIAARRREYPATTIALVATASDAAMVVLAARFGAIPGLLDGGLPDLVIGCAALLALVSGFARNADAVASRRLDAHKLAALHHELRTPLNAVIGFAGLLRTLPGEQVDAARCQDYARLIEAGGEHMLAVLERATGAVPATVPMVDLDLVVAECLDLLAPLAASRAVTLSRRLAARPMQALADGPTVRQILINLIANAIKFSPAGGSVEVATVRRPGGGLEIAVRDHGMGMEAGELATVGHPFRRGAEARTRNIEGTGLGLAISRRLAERQGGSIDLQSRPGVGTTARVNLAEYAPRLYSRPLGPQLPTQSGITVNPLFAISGP